MNQLTNLKMINNETANIKAIEEFGLSIIPLKLDKKPIARWNEYKIKISPISLWYTHYQSSGNVGIICGKISGNVECIDIDVKNDPEGTIAKDYRKLIPEDLVKRLIIQKTPSKGYHFIYSCPDTIIERSQKLANHTDGKVLIETRGEGGYFCTHTENYRKRKGQFDLKSLNVEIPVITPDERKLLLEMARSLNRFFPVKDNKYHYKEQAINEFNENFDIIKLFQDNNWEVVKEDDLKYYLKCPNTSSTHSGYYFKETKTFYCFSTSTKFKQERPYNHFQILPVLEGLTDYRNTINRLKDYGYTMDKIEDDKNKKKISADQIAEYLVSKDVKYDEFIQDLTINGRILEERDNNTLYIDIQKEFNKSISRNQFEDTIKSHYIESFHPIKAFVEKYHDRKPDGMFQKWMDCIELKNPNISKEILIIYFKKWYVGMIAQALDGDYPNEFFLALLSTAQGLGKTTLLRKYTIPEELQKYCKEHSLDFNDDYKVIMSQALLIIDDEMDGHSYSEDKEFKTVLSTSELTLRRKYDRRISTMYRRCSFAGSGNSTNVIRERINRRIIPIEILKIDYKKTHELDLIDLFMEAYNLFKSGFKYSFEASDMDKLKTIYEDYISKSDLDEIIDSNIDKPENEDDIRIISNIDIITNLTNQYPSMTKRICSQVVGKILNDCGYECIRKGKNKVTCYKISKNSKIFKNNDIIEINHTSNKEVVDAYLEKRRQHQ